MVPFSLLGMGETANDAPAARVGTKSKWRSGPRRGGGARFRLPQKKFKPVPIAWPSIERFTADFCCLHRRYWRIKGPHLAMKAKVPVKRLYQWERGKWQPPERDLFVGALRTALHGMILARVPRLIALLEANKP